ncbi:MAG: hypothetical protein ACI9HX_000852 [Pseudoalteromonas tetraodonis]
MDYLFNQQSLNTPAKLRGTSHWYWGLGARFKIRDNDNDDDFAGVRLPFGINFYPQTLSLELFAEIVPAFNELSYQGVPDVRVIVFQGIPVAAMIRLPSRLSNGNVNLHQGAIGVGIDLKIGITGLEVTQNRAQTLRSWAI